MDVDEVLKIDNENKEAWYHKCRQTALMGYFQPAKYIMENWSFSPKMREDLAKFIQIEESFRQNKGINWYRAIKYE